MTPEEENELCTKLGDAYREIRRLKELINYQDRVNNIKLEALRRDFKEALARERAKNDKTPRLD